MEEKRTCSPHSSREWFDGLWHGKQLAFTVAVLTVIAAGAFKFFATPLPPDPEATDRKRLMVVGSDSSPARQQRATNTPKRED